MADNMQNIYIWIVLAPLIGAIIAGFFGKQIGRSGAHWVTIIGVAISCVLSILVFKHINIDGGAIFNGTIYQWMAVDGLNLEVGFLVDELTSMMMVVVTFVSLMVHIYTIGYMKEDPGYQRFFSYISLFTFSMLMLIMANNFMQLFFGWEAVGLVSYLLIGFWYTRDTAIYANMKAFLVNRVGDFGFLLGIAAVLMYFGSLDYATVFAGVDKVNGQTMEIDMLLENGSEIVVVEVKSTLRVNNVREFLVDLDQFLDFFPQHRDKTIYGAVAGLNIEESADRFAYRNGLFVLSVTGDGLVKILNNEQFQPTDFGAIRRN
jgi:NADH:ubiquinone oxidoreductase subunit 2 (subunit N)